MSVRDDEKKKKESWNAEMVLLHLMANINSQLTSMKRTSAQKRGTVVVHLTATIDLVSWKVR